MLQNMEEQLPPPELAKYFGYILVNATKNAWGVGGALSFGGGLAVFVLRSIGFEWATNDAAMVLSALGMIAFFFIACPWVAFQTYKKRAGLAENLEMELRREMRELRKKLDAQPPSV